VQSSALGKKDYFYLSLDFCKYLEVTSLHFLSPLPSVSAAVQQELRTLKGELGSCVPTLVSGLAYLICVPFLTENTNLHRTKRITGVEGKTGPAKPQEKTPCSHCETKNMIKAGAGCCLLLLCWSRCCLLRGVDSVGSGVFPCHVVLVEIIHSNQRTFTSHSLLTTRQDNRLIMIISLSRRA